MKFAPSLSESFGDESRQNSGTTHLQVCLHIEGYVDLGPQTTIYKCLFQLDDEPNLYIENGWKSPNIHLEYSESFMISQFVLAKGRFPLYIACG